LEKIVRKPQGFLTHRPAKYRKTKSKNLYKSNSEDLAEQTTHSITAHAHEVYWPMAEMSTRTITLLVATA